MALTKVKSKLIVNTVMLVSLFEFHFSESFAVFDEKGEEKQESIKFVARLIESEKVRISYGSFGRSCDLTLFSLATLLISQNLKQEIWKLVVDALENKVS